ncbi:hypothetical protein COV82_04995, partial [Candidatus Peregrinibacteria bacterium CG11_big_fil_rev_8_21_14_0_20_46_8]
MSKTSEAPSFSPEEPPKHAALEKLGAEFKEALMEKSSGELLRDLVDDLKFKDAPDAKVTLTSGTSTILLQAILTKEGWDTRGVDGSYGPKTRAAVEKMQRDLGIGADGIFGAKSLRALATHLKIDLEKLDEPRAVIVDEETGARHVFAEQAQDSHMKLEVHGEKGSPVPEVEYQPPLEDPIQWPDEDEINQYRRQLKQGGVTISGDYDPAEAAQEYGEPRVSVAGQIDVPVQTPKHKTRKEKLNTIKSYMGESGGDDKGPIAEFVDDDE